MTPAASSVTAPADSLADLPNRNPVWEMRVDGQFLRWCGTLEQFRKDCLEYCDRSNGHWEKLSDKQFRFISPDEPKVTRFHAVKAGDAAPMDSDTCTGEAPAFAAPAPDGRVGSVCNACVLNEWARMATQAYKAGHNEIGRKFSTAATMTEGAEVCPKWFDAMQDVYRAWLVFGWDQALPEFDRHFGAPTSPSWLPAPVGVSGQSLDS